MVRKPKERRKTMADEIEKELTYKLLSADEIANGFYFKFNVGVILRADQKTQLEALREAVNGGIYTPNECRSLLDREAKPGGDDLIVNGTMVKLTQVGAAYNKQTAPANSNGEEE